MTREETLRGMFDTTAFGLEIGPSYNPLLPRSQGYNVEILDYADKATLVEKYRRTKDVDIRKIQHVDYVSNGRSMSEVIDKKHCYDFIVASHVIEHTPDFVRFFIDCQNLLKPNGVLVLAVPDKRYCFDLFQPLTTTGSVLQAFLEKRTRPNPGAIFDSVAYDVTKSGKIGWPEDDYGTFDFNSTLEKARMLFTQAQLTSDYIDVHVWRFVPSSFRLLIRDLYDLAFIGLHESNFIRRSGHEFYIALARQRSHFIPTREELARDVLLELGAINILGPVSPMTS